MPSGGTRRIEPTKWRKYRGCVMSMMRLSYLSVTCIYIYPYIYIYIHICMYMDIFAAFSHIFAPTFMTMFVPP